MDSASHRQGYHTTPAPILLQGDWPSAIWLLALPHGVVVSDQKALLLKTQARLDQRRQLAQHLAIGRRCCVIALAGRTHRQ